MVEAFKPLIPSTMQQSIKVPAVVSVHLAINVAVPRAPPTNSGLSSGVFVRISLGGVIFVDAGPGNMSGVGSVERHSRATSFSGMTSLRQMGGGDLDVPVPQPKTQALAQQRVVQDTHRRMKCTFAVYSASCREAT